MMTRSTYRSEIADKVGRRIMLRRKCLGMSQRTVADAMEIERPEISKWERGHTCPTIASLLNLAKALQCSPAELLPRGSEL